MAGPVKTKVIGAQFRNFMHIPLILSIIIVALSMVGFCVSAWLCADLTSTHYILWQLTQSMSKDHGIVTAFYLMISACLLSPLLILVDHYADTRGSKVTVYSTAAQILSIALCLLFILMHLSSAILANSYRTQTEHQVKPALLEMLANHTYMRREPNARWIYMDEGLKINYLQNKFSCCGLDGQEDYDAVHFAHRHEGEPFPYSCCLLKDGASWDDTDLSDVQDLFLCQSLNPEAVHLKGCVVPLQEWLKSRADFILGFSLTLMFLLIGLLALNSYLIYQINGRPF